jgi:HEAT repeat protein
MAEATVELKDPGTAGLGASLGEGKSMKINMNELNGYLSELTQGEPSARQSAVRGLAKYSAAEWEGNLDAIDAVVGALVGTGSRRSAAPDSSYRSEVAKALGNIGTQSPSVVPELLRLLQEDADGRVRAEAVRALGKIGEGAADASRAIAAVLTRPGEEETLRADAAWALARVAPLAPGTAAALGVAAGDRSGHVGVCAAEALWRVSGEAGRAVPALAARLGDPNSRGAAVQALYRIGPKAKAAVPALLAAARDKNRLFRESVVMALRKIDPQAADKAGVR